ncbi:hypothetical protein ES708_11013 [subsurface metagenome]
MEYQEKFIAYVDILGFKKLVKESENGTGMTLSELMELPKCLGTPDDVLRFKKFGPTTCPASSCINRDLDFKLTQISEWLDYMKHLKNNYPYLFSLAMRTNPFDANASVEVIK